MARETSTAFSSKVKLTKEVFNSGISAGAVIGYRYGDNSASSYTTRDDIRTTPVVDDFRAPLPYKASGFHKQSVLVNAELHVLTNAGTKRTVNRWSGTNHENTNLLVPPASTTRLISLGERERLLVSLLKRVGDQKWSLGVAVLEAREAISLIAGTARKLQSALLCAANKNWKGLARVLNVQPAKLGKHGSDTAQGWLAYSFAWGPLVDDMANSALFLGGLFDSDKLLMKAKGSLRKRESSKSVGTSLLWGQASGGTNLGIAFEDKLTLQSDLKMSLYYKVSASQLRDLVEIGLIGLSTPWAVLPSSYLVDWVLPIGDVLESWDAQLGLTFQGGSFTHFDSSTVVRKYTGTVAGTPGILMPGAVFEWLPADRFSMVRTVYSNNPVPLPQYFKNPFDTWKAVTAIALLKQ